MTTTYTQRPVTTPRPDPDVYPPQEDSHLLIELMTKVAHPRGLSVADLCTGSGVIALAAGAAPAVVLVGILDPVHHPGVGTNT